MQSRVSKPQPAGHLHMVLFKAVHEKEQKLLEDFILFQGKSLEFLGTLHLSCLPWLLHSLCCLLSLDTSRGQVSSCALGRFWASVQVLICSKAEQDCHSIIFCAIPV